VTTITDILGEHQGREGPLLPILHDVQKAFGYISEAAMREIATGLNLTRAEVYGVVSFYHDFRQQPETRPVIKLCRAEACKARGVEALVPLSEAQARVKVEAVYCLGLCAVGPAAMMGDQVFARLDSLAFSDLLESAA
jgi:formate dehydrogenase subunit gamma